MIYPKYKIIGVFGLMIAIVFGCKRKDEVIHNQAAWSSKEPTAIPIAQRKNQKRSGNLIFNPSFETGKIYYEKSNIKSFDVTGWKKTGENVQWVDIETKKFNQDEVFEGTRAIKIFRTQTDETEELGVGILSDYIKVIPGNYSLSMYLKLENIFPNRARLGTKLHDAVNIRLQFFDKNKIEIPGNEYDPYRHTNIDNGFKSINLTNYWNINQFGWGEINGQSAKFPFVDGDIPDEARYVKIFIGLKGPGTMWIDNVNFEYTGKNFTFLERLKPYFDSSFTTHDLLIPQPKHVKKLIPLPFFEKGTYPVILIPENPQRKTLWAAQKIKSAFDDIFTRSLKDYSSEEVRIITNISRNNFDSKPFIVSLGKTNLYKAYKKSLSDSLILKKEQGYFITQLKEAPNIVFLYGFDNDGNYNAAQTFNQLIKIKDFMYHSAEIIDYPDFTQRSFLLHEFNGTVDQLTKNLQFFADHKLNHVYFEVYENMTEYYPFEQVIPDIFVGQTSIMVDLLEFNGSDNFDVDYKLNHELSRRKNTLIAHKIATLSPPSLNNILIKGDYLQSYNSTNPEWIKFNTNENLSLTLQDYHSDLLNTLDKKIKADIEFLSPWSRLDYINLGMGQAEFFYRDLMKNISENIPIYWTGGSYCSPSIDYAEWFRMSKLIKANPVLFDNSLNYSLLRYSTPEAKSYYAGKLRVLSIFEPLKADYSENFHQMNNSGKVILNIDSLTQINALKAITAADYYWNTGSYNADKTIWKALVKYYGTENAQNLIYFNDAYFGLLELCQKIKNNGVHNKNFRFAAKFLEDLNYYNNLLEKDLADEELLHELIQLKKELVNEYKTVLSLQNY
ncbi:MAG: beta-N-acetylglucosaminidase domain-containing protein [Bacteroidales bacterium]